MERTNFFTRIKDPLNITNSLNTRLFSNNIGDCGNVVFVNNIINNFYDTRITTLLNNTYMNYVSALNTGWSSSRQLNLAQSSARLIWSDTAVISPSGATSRYGELRVNITTITLPTTYGFFGLFAYGGNINGRIEGAALTNWNTNQEMSVFGVSGTALYPLPYTILLISASSTPNTLNFTVSTSIGQLTLGNSGTYGKKYRFSFDIVIGATFDNNSYLIFRLYKQNIVIGTQTYYLNSDMRSYNLIYQTVIITETNGSDFGQIYRATIQYMNGSNLTPNSSTVSTYYNSFLVEEL
jgi:hypothetical protein